MLYYGRIVLNYPHIHCLFIHGHTRPYGSRYRLPKANSGRTPSFVHLKNLAYSSSRVLIGEPCLRLKTVNVPKALVLKGVYLNPSLQAPLIRLLSVPTGSHKTSTST